MSASRRTWQERRQAWRDARAGETHRRWMRFRTSPRYRTWIAGRTQRRDDIEKQCFNCIFFQQLGGAFAADWGVCINPLGFDGELRLEHDGCEAHEQVLPGGEE